MKQILYILLISLSAGCFSRVPPVKTGHEKQPLPDFPLLLHDSITYIKTKDLPKGKPFVIFLFSPTCPYCQAEMNEITDKISLLKGYTIYAITPWPFIQMRAFYKRHKLQEYPNIVVANDVTNFFENYCATPGVPFTAIYNKDKRLKQSFVGKLPCEQIKEVIEH